MWEDAQLGTVHFRKHPRCRRMVLRLKEDGHLWVTLPRHASLREGIAFLDTHRDWALAARERLMERAASRPTPRSPQQWQALREEALRTLPGRLWELAGRFGLHPATVHLRANRTRWGSCSARGNINLNVALCALPEHLRDYVLLHELSHLRHMNHGEAFHTLLETLCADLLGDLLPGRPVHRALEKELKAHSPEGELPNP